VTVFRVGITSDIVGADGRLVFDLDALEEAPGVETVFVGDPPELGPADVADLDALVLFKPRVAAATLAETERLLLVARLGVGVDNVDVDACTERGVLVTTTPDGVRRPMAAGAMAFLLALAHRLPEMDRHVREGGWERFRHVGAGLQGRTLGIVGLGNIGRDLVGLAAPFGFRIIATDPYLSDPVEGVELVRLEELLATADFVVVAAPLTWETRHLLDAERLALLRPSAYLINISRGPIVDQRALAELLAERRIAGAALDVFEQEPVDPADPLLTLDNVILAPHALGLTDELLRLGGQSVSRSVLAVERGEIPEYVLDRRVLERPGVQERLAARSKAG
jgi:D-3-phosphoglycerate dehydrogenase